MTDHAELVLADLGWNDEEPSPAPTAFPSEFGSIGLPQLGDHLPRAPDDERPARPARLRPLGKKAAVVVALLVAAYLVHTRLVTPLIYHQRQQHFASDLKTPKPDIAEGDALGIVQIPSLGTNVVFTEGVSVDGLRGGPAHVGGSALPGDAGVMVLVGHRTAYGAPFASLAKLPPKDTVVVQTRNNGPIVSYVVDRVERHTSLSAVGLDKTDVISYLLLVGGDSGFMSNGQVIVVARALPVTAVAPVLPDLSKDVDNEVPFGIDALLAFGSAGAAVAVAQAMRSRVGTSVRLVAVAPVAVYAALRLVMLLDSVLPVLR